MKRTTIVSFIAVLVIGVMMLCGCAGTTPGPSENTVSPWQAADEVGGQALDLVTGNDNYEICQFSAGPENRWLSLGYEYYEKGKLIEDVGQGETDLYADEETKGPAEGLIAVVERGDKMQFSAGTGGTEICLSDVEMKNFDAGDLASGVLTEPQKIEPGRKIYLKAYASNKDATSITAPQSMVEDQNLLSANDKTWLIYVMFSEKAQDNR